jgi:hypothetical protein
MKTTTLLDRSLLAAGGPAERGSSCREGQRAQGMMLSDIDAFESQRITDVIYARGQRAQGMMLSNTCRNEQRIDSARSTRSACTSSIAAFAPLRDCFSRRLCVKNSVRFARPIPCTAPPCVGHDT